jgi:phosphatidylserine/phosphatidylglycerophosphate/cardiolipin synthase-like enzyme
MQGFDIDSLLRFSPPEFLCERCFAILNPTPDVRVGRCPICGVSYVATEEFPTCEAYLQSKGLQLRFRDPVAQGRKLAHVARMARESLSAVRPEYPPMRALLAALANAEQFVHFTTFGVSALLLGAIKVTAQSVPVRGLISGVKNDSVYRELTQHGDEAPLFNARVFPQDGQWYPHQKVIVIDGLLAFKGSANLTDFGWRKAAQGGEVIEVVTELREIADLHNRFFSAAWALYDEARQGEQIYMSSF